MPATRRQTIGTVASLHVGNAKKSPSTSVPSLTLTFAGIVSDRHCGPTRTAGAREPAFRRGTLLANLRQVSLVSMEELNIMASRMGLQRLDPGWLAANIAIEGAGPITQIPRGTVLRFPSGASLYISDLNSPCRAAANLIRRCAGAPECRTSKFVWHSMGRRGLVAFVYVEGDVYARDPIEFLFPQPELPN
jgi:MOSC domain-containing protein